MAVAVRDHGVGFEASQARQVFHRFWRADPARARTVGGTGPRPGDRHGRREPARRLADRLGPAGDGRSVPAHAAQERGRDTRNLTAATCATRPRGAGRCPPRWPRGANYSPAPTFSRITVLTCPATSSRPDNSEPLVRWPQSRLAIIVMLLASALVTGRL